MQQSSIRFARLLAYDATSTSARIPLVRQGHARRPTRGGPGLGLPPPALCAATRLGAAWNREGASAAVVRGLHRTSIVEGHPGPRPAARASPTPRPSRSPARSATRTCHVSSHRPPVECGSQMSNQCRANPPCLPGNDPLLRREWSRRAPVPLRPRQSGCHLIPEMRRSGPT